MKSFHKSHQVTFSVKISVDEQKCHRILVFLRLQALLSNFTSKYLSKMSIKLCNLRRGWIKEESNKEYFCFHRKLKNFSHFLHDATNLGYRMITFIDYQRDYIFLTSEIRIKTKLFHRFCIPAYFLYLARLFFAFTWIRHFELVTKNSSLSRQILLACC